MFEKILGVGAFGLVVKALHIENNNYVAIKVIPKKYKENSS